MFDTIYVHQTDSPCLTYEIVHEDRHGRGGGGNGQQQEHPLLPGPCSPSSHLDTLRPWRRISIERKLI